MRTLRTTTLVVATLAVGFAAVVVTHFVSAPAVGPPKATEGWLVVSNAMSGDLSLLSVSDSSTAVRPLPCFPLGRWAIRVGVEHGYVVVLDAQTPAVVLVSLDVLGRVAAGTLACSPGQDLVSRRVVIASGHVPYGGLIVGDRLYVSYFADNVIEIYDWTEEPARAPPDLRLAGETHFAAAENLGLSEMAFRDGTLVVAANGYACFVRDCPGGRLHASHLFFVPPEPVTFLTFPEVRPGNLNAAGLYTHAATGAVYVIAAGDFAAGYGSLQRLHPDRTLGPEISLPGNGAPRAAFPLGDALFAVLQFSGEHLFLIDAAHDRLTRILRFDDAAFREIPLTARVLPDRAEADFQDLLADPSDPDRYLLIDGKGERLVQFTLDPASARLRVTTIISLGTPAYRSFPQWGIWLTATSAQGAQAGA